MSENLHELFQTAAKFFFGKYKENGGTLGKLALELGTSHTYISAVINGSRTASLELQSHIARTLYGPYDKFIAAGRRIKCGLKPECDYTKETGKTIESLIAQLTYYFIHQRGIEQQLKAYRQKYADICRTVGDIIFELNENMVFTHLAGGAHEAIDRIRDEMLDKYFFDFLDTAETARLQPLLDESIKKNHLLECDINVLLNGKLENQHIMAKPIFTDKGDFKASGGH